ncbi:MAG: NUDIX domain-containing protein [Alphaproteobacteria bacterium]|nr:NUDIX domain-containing protein [Alphaproteobacteria bacterium]
MLKVYNNKMEPLYNEDKKIVHRDGLWHKVVTGILFNPQNDCLYFQTIYPKESYGFDRPDYIDFSIGGHVEGDETVEQALYREAKEEFGIDVNDYDFLGIRICNCNPTPNYKIKEFQFFYGLKTKQKLKEMNFKNSGNEVKSVLEINIDDFLSILMKEKNTITANEMLLDKQTRAGTYSENVLVSAEQIIPDYFRDKSILEKILTIKSMMQL